MFYFVDSHLHIVDLTWDNLKSMYMAGIRIIVSPIQLGAAKRVSYETIKDMWDFQLEVQLKRAKEHFIDCYSMIGISMVSTPKNNLGLLLEWLKDYLKLPKVVAIGEIGFEPGSWTSKDLNEQEKIVREQLKIAKEFKKTVDFHTPPANENKIKYTKILLDLCKKYSISSKKVIVDHCNDANIEFTLKSGAFAAITVQPWRGITPEIAADIIIKYGFDRIMVNSDCSGAISDPLAVPKTAYELRKKGVSEENIKKVCCENALEAYGIKDYLSS